MFPKFTEFIADEQPKARLAEAERNRLAKALPQETFLMNVKAPNFIRIINFLLNLF